MMFSPQGTSSEVHAGQDMLMSVSPVTPAGLSTSQQTSSQTQHASSPFLPGFLLGDHHNLHQQQHGLSSPRLWSTPSSHSPSQKTGLSSQSMQTSQSGSTLDRRESGRARMGGPPVKSLYSSSPSMERSSSQIGFPPNQSINLPPSSLRSANMSVGGSPACGNLSQTPVGGRDLSGFGMSSGWGQGVPVSPAQVDPFYTQGGLKSDDVLDETWVTVFGFLPGASSFILQQFAQYGTILKHVVASECNWMHIQYQSKIQAKKALSKDGKIFGGCMKIGVTVCIEKNVMDDKENNTSSILSPKSSKEFTRESGLTPIRPLTAAYTASKSDYEVLQDKQTPKRDHGVVSKLKEYMFGY